MPYARQQIVSPRASKRRDNLDLTAEELRTLISALAYREDESHPLLQKLRAAYFNLRKEG